MAKTITAGQVQKRWGVLSVMLFITLDIGGIVAWNQQCSMMSQKGLIFSEPALLLLGRNQKLGENSILNSFKEEALAQRLDHVALMCVIIRDIWWQYLTKVVKMAFGP